MIKVYHNAQFLDYYGNGHMVDPEALQWVADIDTNSLDTAFEVTQNIDSDWQTNPLVIRAKDRARSTSAGDVMVDGQGQAWVVASFGFDPYYHHVEITG